MPLNKNLVHQMGKLEPASPKLGLSANVALEKAASKNQIISNICQVWSDLVRNFSNRFDQIQVLPDFGWNWSRIFLTGLIFYWREQGTVKVGMDKFPSGNTSKPNKVSLTLTSLILAENLLPFSSLST